MHKPLTPRSLDLLTRKRRRLLMALEAHDRGHLIHLFMYNARKVCKDIIHPEKLYPLAAELFELKLGKQSIGDPELDLGQTDQCRALVLAILHYMVLERKIVLSRRQFYWRDYPYEAMRRTRSSAYQAEDAEATALAEEEPFDGKVLQLGSLTKLQEEESKDD